MPDDPKARLVALLARARGSTSVEEQRTCALLFLQKLDEYGFEMRVVPKGSREPKPPIVPPAPVEPSSRERMRRAARVVATSVAREVASDPDPWLESMRIVLDLFGTPGQRRAVKRTADLVERQRKKR